MAAGRRTYIRHQPHCNLGKRQSIQPQVGPFPCFLFVLERALGEGSCRKTRYVTQLEAMTSVQNWSETSPSKLPLPCRGASGSDGQTSHTCLEVSGEPCWGPGERSVLGVLPGLEMRLPKGGQDRGGQMCPRPRQGPCWPQCINPLTRAITRFQAQSVPVPRLDHGKVVPCGFFGLVFYSTPIPSPTSS